jgi:hypothetical protein
MINLEYLGAFCNLLKAWNNAGYLFSTILGLSAVLCSTQKFESSNIAGGIRFIE